jgi:hypothetical protein
MDLPVAIVLVFHNAWSNTKNGCKLPVPDKSK